MQFEMMAILGPEGILLLGGILFVSLALSGFRLAGSGAGASGPAGGVVSVGGRQPEAFSAQAPGRPRPSKEPLAWCLDGSALAPRTGLLRTLGRFGYDVLTATRAEQLRNRARQRAAQVRVAETANLAACVRATAASATAAQDGGLSRSQAAPLDHDAQWAKLCRVVEGNIDRADDVKSLHVAALRQLDAVDYAYERMLVELTSVLPHVAEQRQGWRDHREKVTSAVLDDSKTDELVGALRGASASAAPASPVRSPVPAAQVRQFAAA